ncbi:hypothetical protein ACN42_g2337 [Penicillium freii]|uniref:Fungal N-terminal domain-containing protein n=1 Tax=Penicillium freii TaxID=48697 RepID=A0A124GSK9_PENFR|nr:hypothetical protein N7501_012227 [Penicillium viridicatum]KUM64746.1 hypothetical protein ACN42_g2337 [Penicillium freii]
MMPDLTSTGATTVQVAKAAQRGVLALLENIQASERTSELLNKVGRQLLSTKKRLESIISEVEGTYSCDIRLSCKVHIHLRAAISNTQDACERFLGTFKEWKDHSPSLYLHESDSGSFDIFEETELRLFSESLQMLENTILMAEENSVLLDEIPISRALSDVEWTSILSRENELFSAAIDMNRKQHVLQDRRLALKRIVRESEAYEVGTQYHRNFLGELLSEISRLRSGQPVYTEEEDQLPIDAINTNTGDHQFPQRDEALQGGESPIPTLANMRHPCPFSQFPSA